MNIIYAIIILGFIIGNPYFVSGEEQNPQIVAESMLINIKSIKKYSYTLVGKTIYSNGMVKNVVLKYFYNKPSIRIHYLEGDKKGIEAEYSSGKLIISHYLPWKIRLNPDSNAAKGDFGSPIYLSDIASQLKITMKQAKRIEYGGAEEIAGKKVIKLDFFLEDNKKISIFTSVEKLLPVRIERFNFGKVSSGFQEIHDFTVIRSGAEAK